MTHAEKQQQLVSLLTTAWALSGQRPPQGGSLRVSRPVLDQPEVRATLTREGHKGILVLPSKLSGMVIQPGLRPQAGGVLSAEVAGFSEDGGSLKQGLHIWCRDPALSDVFAMFCALLCGRIPDEPIAAALTSCAEEFRRLISMPGDRVSADVVGLVGELIWLRRIIDIDPRAIMTWQGPTGGRHDFRRGNVAVEVKTSLRSASQISKVHISSIDQLVPPADGALFLHVIQLERTEGGEASTLALIDSICNGLQGDLLGHFNKQIKNFKIADDPPDTSFSVMMEQTYEVRWDFPRIVPESLIGGVPSGISGVGYDLRLDAAGAFLVPPQSAAQAIINAEGK